MVTRKQWRKHYNFANNSTDLSSVYKQVHTQLFFEHVTQHSSLVHCFRLKARCSCICRTATLQLKSTPNQCVCMCVFPEKASSSTLRACNTALITHPLTFLKAHFESGRENPNQLDATERTLMSRERILRRSRCSAIFSPRRMSESSWRARGEVLQNSPKFCASPSMHYTPVMVCCYLPAVFTELQGDFWMKHSIWWIMCLGDTL